MVLELEFDGKLLQRGFWVYVWRIAAPQDRVVFYVGRTGDSSSPNASSPFGRMSAHFRSNPRGNALLRNLEEAGVDPVGCRFKLFALGPVFPEQPSFESHRPFRDRTATLEAAVATELRGRGHDMLGRHPGGRNPSAEVLGLVNELLEAVFESDGGSSNFR